MYISDCPGLSCGDLEAEIIGLYLVCSVLCRLFGPSHGGTDLRHSGAPS